jgi:hypothetical protein
LLLRLADRDQIAAVTHLAADPGQSYMSDRARGLGITNGLAEQVIALRPDLVLAGVFSARVTVRLLERLGRRTRHGAAAGLPGDPAADPPRLRLARPAGTGRSADRGDG